MINQLCRKSLSTHSWIGGLALSIPAWISSDRITIQHGYAIMALLIVMIIDWITGSSLARKSDTVRLTSSRGISAINRDFVMLLIPVLGTVMDHVLGSKSYLFAFFVGSLIWQNGYSVLGNIVTLKWNDRIPTKLYLFMYKIVEDEVKEKLDKYFKGDLNNEKKKK